jgi:hypothetical protein
MVLVGFSSIDEFSIIGNGKNTRQFGSDILIGDYNKWQIDVMGSAGVGNGVINFFNYVNNPLRLTVSTGIKEGVK